MLRRKNSARPPTLTVADENQGFDFCPRSSSEGERKDLASLAAYLASFAAIAS
jgi:hypothetical protein